MTAPDLVAVVEAAMEDHYHLELEHDVWSCACGHEFGLLTSDTSADVEHREHQARAVLAALEAVGVSRAVYGVLDPDGEVIEYPELSMAKDAIARTLAAIADPEKPWMRAGIYAPMTLIRCTSFDYRTEWVPVEVTNNTLNG